MEILEKLSRKGLHFLSLALIVGVGISVAGGVFAATTVGNDVSIGGTLTQTGAATFNGSVTVGDSTSDSLTVTARLASNVVPSTSNSYDLGANGLAWNEIFASGTAYIGGVSSTSGIYPTTSNDRSLGADGLAWKNIFVSSTAYVGGVTSTGGLYPSSNNAYPVGSFNLSWSNVFASGTLYGQTAVFANASATSSISLKSDSAGLGGSIIVEDADGSNCTEIGANDGVVFARVVTCP